MSDSFGRISSPSPTSGNNARGGLAVQILKLPAQLNNNVKAIRLEGQVTQLNNNGVVRITTPAGDIEVKIKGNRQPQKGQSIEIELPVGRPPKQGTIRDAPQQNINRGGNNGESNARITAPSAATPVSTVITNPRITTPLQPQTSQVDGNNSTGTNNTQTPTTLRPATPTPPLPAALQESVAQGNTTNNTALAQTRPLSVEAVVRLLAVPPAQAQTIATEYLQTLPQPQTAVISKAVFTANLIAQNAQNQLIQPLLQTTQSAIVQNAPPVQNILQNVSQPLQSNNFFQAQPVQQILVPPQITALPTTTLLPPVQTQIIPDGQTFPIKNAAEILQIPTTQSNLTNPTPINIPNTPQPATLTTLPINFDPTNPNSLISSRFQKIDVQIIQILPPTPTITVPTTTPINATPIVPATTTFTPPIISSNTAPTITAQVTGFTQGGLPLVTAQLPGSPLPQSFALQFSSNNLQLGSQLQIIPKTVPVPVVPMMTPQQNILNNMLRGFQWPALDELYNNLLQVSPQAAASLTRSLPNAGNPQQLGSAAMMFIAAIKSGDLASFLGDKKMDIIRSAGKSDILSKLTQAATSTSRAATVEPASSGDWRAVPLPMFWESEIHKITLYTKYDQQNNQQQDNKGNGQTRFIFDLSLSRMGDVQLDGLLRDKRLDLVVRTQNAFSEPMQQTMRQAYSAALHDTDLSGDLSFQGSTKNWVHVLEQKEQLGVHV